MVIGFSIWSIHIGLFVAFLGQVFTSNTLHRHMSTDDLRNVFHVEHHSSVPEYEVVKIHSIRKREIGNLDDGGGGSRRTKEKTSEDDSKVLKFSAFGQNLNLNLQKSDSLFKDKLKMFIAEPRYLRVALLHFLGDTYQDEFNQAAILLLRDKHDGTLLMEGTIGHDLVVKPIPSHVRKHALDANSQEDSLPANVTLGNKDFVHHQHIVYRRNSAHSPDLSDYAFMEPDAMPTYTKKKRTKRSSRTKREAPYVIYPEILVIVDYDGYRCQAEHENIIPDYSQNTPTYLRRNDDPDNRYAWGNNYWTSVTTKSPFNSFFTTPKMGRDATPYLERNRVGRDAIDSAAALTDMGKYLFRERRLPVYDIAVAVTKYDMCRRRKGGRCTKGTAGFAYVGGACVVNKRLEKVNSVAIIEDTGGFSGIIVAAHEVGHLLGAVHDGSPPPTYLGGPGAEKCRWEDGFIMSDLRHTEKGFKWSPCSVSSFHHFLNGDTATCLFNSPHEDESLPRVLPGKLLSLDAQCRKDRGTSACFKDDRVCSQLFCFDAGSGYCVAYRPAAEGSSCGDGQFCSGGRCQAEHENIIPDYSQNTPTYLRERALALWARGQASSSGEDCNFVQHLAPGLQCHVKRNLGLLSVISVFLGDDSNCVDHAIIPGALSCFDYLTKYGFEQCSTDYVKRNCCAAHKYICSGRR
ncbi:A disintegrin and metalloproteinase with thrombospondin motifs 18 [Diaphorina citri]|uniref:A disintegrin and metalloproteinase with thrombospondin motifs 18 n=1 Tax=Diaphorina citri TaxID=121845 RepID=A0A3Q0IXN5_DIACI|nr:A disintegrin and metalloproteinase with thrombospondin motifs 18 [Diaphorina citri]